MMLNTPLLNLVITQAILKSKIREDHKPKEWFNIVTLLNQRGFLYYGFQEGRLARIAIAYRVPEITNDVDSFIPDVEEGKILWVANYISFDSNKNSLKDEIMDFFARYKDIDEIAFESPNGKIIRIKRKVADEQQEKNRHQVA